MLTIPTIETFTLTETKDKKITLTAYVKGATPDVPPSLCRKAVLICPGGGYRYCSNIEVSLSPSLILRRDLMLLYSTIR